MSRLRKINPIPFNHIHAYYDRKWQANHCLAWNLLRGAYYKLSHGIAGPMEIDFLR